MKRINFFTVYLMIFLTITFLIISSKIEEVKFTNVINQNEIYVDAESCVVINQDNDILYSKNIHKKLLPASITKILTCITVIENFPLDNYIYITTEMINTIGSKIYLKEGDFISVKDLLYGLMLNSGNDAANVLECAYSGNSSDFIYLMNKICKRVGMKNSYFNNASGLDNETTNITTAYDMAILTNYCIKNKDFLKIFGTKKHNVQLEDRNLYFRHKHRLIHSDDLIIGGKTGILPS